MVHCCCLNHSACRQGQQFATNPDTVSQQKAVDQIFLSVFHIPASHITLLGMTAVLITTRASLPLCAHVSDYISGDYTS